MNANKTPLQLVNEEHGGKAKLVDKILGMLESRNEGEEQDSLKARLLAASNKKLLHLVKVTESVKEKYGSRDKLVAGVAEALGRAKDSDFVKRLSAFTNARLLDMANLLHRRGRAAAAAPAGHEKAAKAPKAEKAPKSEAKAKPAKAAAATKAAKPAKAKAGTKPAAEKKPAKKSAKK